MLTLRLALFFFVLRETGMDKGRRKMRAGKKGQKVGRK